MKNFLKQKNTKKYLSGFTRTLKLVSGFTLIETMIALSIFTISVLSLMLVLGNGITDTNYVKNKVIATYLAQEGIEYVRNIRDTFVLYPGTEWTGFKGMFVGNIGCTTPSIGCYFDYKKTVDINGVESSYGSYNGVFDISSPSTQAITKILVKTCPSASARFTSCPEMQYNVSGPAIGAYNYDAVNPPAVTASGFRRKINVEEINDNEIKVTSTVFWVKGGAQYNVSFTANLFNTE